MFLRSSVFKSELFDIKEFNRIVKEKDQSQKSLESFKFMLKAQISMKYLFIIGDHADFDSEQFREFLETIVGMEGGSPFKMFLYKFNHEILQIEYPYLFVENQDTKKLSLYPYIILNSKNLVDKTSKENFQILIGQNYKIKKE